MKADLDRLMAARGLAAVMVVGGHGENAPRTYLTNGAHVTGGLVIKQQGADPLMIVNPMEIEEAAKSGLRVLSYNDLDWSALVREADGDRSRAELLLWQRALAWLAVPPGKIGLYGVGDVNVYLEMTRRLATEVPGYEFVGEMGMTLFDEAYVTKDAAEIARLRDVAQRTSAVLQATWDFIAGHREQDGVVVGQDGTPLTIGTVRRFVRRALLDRDLEDTGMIFAQGRDGAFPHSRGEDADALRTGQAIVFDLFPREVGGGYHHDSTRTWSIGYASDEVQTAYHEVMDAVEVALDSFRVGMPAHRMQEAVLDYLESKGHPTTRSHPGTETGYVHSLGHGLGLNIHERPAITHVLKDDLLAAGSVFTIEPGVYYPERGFGVRIEDTVVAHADGTLEALTTFHKELVLPLRG